MSRQIFIEIVKEGNTEKTMTSWTKDFSTLAEVIATLQIAMAAVVEQAQHKVQLQQSVNNMPVPPFVNQKGRLH